MSHYIVMIYGDEQVWESWSEEQGRANAAAHGAFHAAHGAAVVGGHELERSWRGRSVRTDPAGRRHVTDGAFLPGATVLGGYYVIEADDLDAALAWAAKVPNAAYGTVEVRPVMDVGAATTA
jgi:hypothetical protein